MTPLQRRTHLRKMQPLGRYLYYLGVVRPYLDGDRANAVFRRWHPLSYLVWIIALPLCGIFGEMVGEVVPFSVGSFFKKHPERLEWL